MVYKFTYKIFFTHSSVDCHLGRYHILAIVNCVTINTGMQVPFCYADLIFFRYIQKSVIAGHMVGLFLVSEEPPYFFTLLVRLEFSLRSLANCRNTCRNARKWDGIESL